jgi:dethiobiotin synthetase
MLRSAADALIRGKGYFVTGTDTGVGKTWVTCRLAELARERGLRVGVLKPAESGDDGDALALARAAGCTFPLEVIRPFAFRKPVAPALAAQLEGKRIRLAPIKKAFSLLADSSEFMLVEGAGGLLVPYAPGLDGAGIAKALGLPLLVVARRGLGTVNHTLLTLEAARSRGLSVAGVILNGPGSMADLSVAHNRDMIQKLGKVKVFES